MRSERDQTGKETTIQKLKEEGRLKPFATVQVTTRMLRAGNAAIVANQWHPMPLDVLKAVYLAMEAARAK